ncbi:hypothetical protein ACFO3O_00305 [Dokdonia ponticola]|uniref:Uncharacterized protein n=1 Tax=Dokdonia ponticola TaxID=2041041 RepID=A0ABV9HST9_9FLAO
MKKFILKIWFWRLFIVHKNTLPTKSDRIHPKMEYELMSGGFIWEDEGLWGMQRDLANAFRYVLHHRTKLVLGPINSMGIMGSDNFDKQIFKMAQKYFPDWIGFHESRCSYNPELADRMMRILKVANWRMDKVINDD